MICHWKSLITKPSILIRQSCTRFCLQNYIRSLYISYQCCSQLEIVIRAMYMYACNIYTGGYKYKWRYSSRYLNVLWWYVTQLTLVLSPWHYTACETEVGKPKSGLHNRGIWARWTPHEVANQLTVTPPRKRCSKFAIFIASSKNCSTTDCLNDIRYEI